MRILFVCTANKLRSPTAEDLFCDMPGLTVLSAGTDPDAPRPLTRELVAETDVIFVMETHHRDRIRKKYKVRPADDRIIALHIPDDFDWGQPELVTLLRDRAGPRMDLLSRAATRRAEN